MAYREILRALVTKELKVKYKRSILGFFWSMITPIALTGIYLFVFIYVYKVPQKDFILFLLTGLLPWNYFNMSLMAATSSFVESGSMIRKVYFPRLLVPIATVTANLVNFLVGLSLLLIVLVVSGRPIWLTLHWLLIAVVLETALAIGLSLILATWNVFFRDIGQLISIAMIGLFFATPVVYDISRVPAPFRPIILANPMSSIIQTYRSSLFRAKSPDLGLLALGAAEVALIFVLGWLVYRRHANDLPKEV